MLWLWPTRAHASAHMTVQVWDHPLKVSRSQGRWLLRAGSHWQMAVRGGVGPQVSPRSTDPVKPLELTLEAWLRNPLHQQHLSAG